MSCTGSLTKFFAENANNIDREEPIAKLQALVTQGFRNTGKTTLPTKKM